MGHVRNYTIGDVIARYKFLMVTGFGPYGMGLIRSSCRKCFKIKQFHQKFGQIKIAKMKEQLQMLGLSIDWDFEISTCDKEYYKHHQELFIDFYNQSLISRKETYVNWDPVEKTVLANEQLMEEDGDQTL